MSLEGTLASAIGSLVMTAVVVALQLVPAGPVAWLVAAVGLLATLLESLLGALLQERTPWLTNELVNAIQTVVAAVLAMAAVVVMAS